MIPKTIFIINVICLTISITLASIFLYRYMQKDYFCSYSDFDKSKSNDLFIQPPYPENAFASNSGDYKEYLNNKMDTTNSIVGVNQHEQDSSSNPVPFISF